jgi:DNA-binding LytR/AlgR family response regulator
MYYGNLFLAAIHPIFQTKTMAMYKTLIIEGNSATTGVLKKVIAAHHPELSIVAEISSAGSAKELLAQLQTGNKCSHQLLIPTANNNKISVAIANITHFKADGQMTIVHFKDKSTLIAFRMLGYFKEKLMSEYSFCLIHHSFLVNVAQVQSYDYGKRVIVLKNGTLLTASRRFGVIFKQYWKTSFEKQV